MKEPAFLSELRDAIGYGVWFNSAELARRLYPNIRGKALVERSKECSRRLSNMQRNAHVERRVARNLRSKYQYRVIGPGAPTDPPPVNSIFTLAMRLQPSARLA